jgi:hypothetical protein
MSFSESLDLLRNGLSGFGLGGKQDVMMILIIQMPGSGSIFSLAFAAST